MENLSPSSQIHERILSRGSRLGFTLVELLAALAIIIVLAALIFPSVKAFREHSQSVGCQNNMRQIVVAALAFSGEHNGWLPPGYPLRNGDIPADQRQPDTPPQAGASGQGLGGALVPNYLGILPLCPSFRLTPEVRKDFPGEKEFERLRKLGGGYALNLIVQQFPLNRSAVSEAHRTPILLESPGLAYTWSMVHQNGALGGSKPSGTAGRNHGGGDRLNFVFLDGHMKTISQNDQRKIPDSEKDWRINKGNTTGYFGASTDKSAAYIQTDGLSDTNFDAIYPNHAPVK